MTPPALYADSRLLQYPRSGLYKSLSYQHY